MKTESESTLDPVPVVVEAIRNGGMVLVVDDEQRENEGDIIMAAEKVTPEAINFMATHGRGLICVALDHQRVLELGLSPMPRSNEKSASLGTAFTESVDAREGISTGISASDRSHTITMLADPTCGAGDFSKPGHIFPLAAHPNGVLSRPGHTESAVDLARMAGLQPAGVICEVLKEDGNMARLDDLRSFAKQYALPICSVQDLILFRQLHETLIEFEREIQLPSRHGHFRLRSYIHKLNGENHLAMVMGNPRREKAPLVRVHSECLTGDVFGSQRCDCGMQLDEAMRMVAEEGEGVILYMRQEGRGIGLGPKLHAYELQEKGLDTVEANEKLGFKADLRDYALSAQMLHDLGLDRVRLITNNPLKVSGLERYGIDITERISITSAGNEHNQRYLATKKEKLGHLL